MGAVGNSVVVMTDWSGRPVPTVGLLCRTGGGLLFSFELLQSLGTMHLMSLQGLALDHDKKADILPFPWWPDYPARR